MMIGFKSRNAKLIVFTLIGLTMLPAYASQSDSDSWQPNQSRQSTSFFSKLYPTQATVIFQAGGFNASQGRSQNINIEGLIGDEFTVTHQHDSNILLGLGYYIDALDKDNYKLLFGLNAFYLAQTSVEGNVIQENLFTNLSYRYYITNYPIYIAVKAIINNSPKYNFTFDLGVGPNFISTSNFSEASLDGGITLPDNIFSGQTRTAFSATAGIGVIFNNVFGHTPLEVSYRVFYLGQGSLKKTNNQVIDTLNTGNSYANALIFSVAT